jgi:hypothetical protein
VEHDREIESAALEAQRGLAKVGHHRLAADLVIAACPDAALDRVSNRDRVIWDPRPVRTRRPRASMTGMTRNRCFTEER